MYYYNVTIVSTFASGHVLTWEKYKDIYQQNEEKKIVIFLFLST